MRKRWLFLFTSSFFLLSSPVLTFGSIFSNLETKKQLEELQNNIDSQYKDVDDTKQKLQQSLSDCREYCDSFMDQITSMASQSSTTEDDKIKCWYYRDCMYIAITDSILFDRDSSVAYWKMLFDTDNSTTVDSTLCNTISLLNSSFKSNQEEAQNIVQDIENDLMAAFEDDFFDGDEYLQLMRDLIPYYDLVSEIQQINSGSASRKQVTEPTSSEPLSNVGMTESELTNKINALTDIQKSALRNSINSVIAKKQNGLDTGNSYSSMLSINLSNLSEFELQTLVDIIDKSN